MNRRDDKRIGNHLLAILVAADDLVHEVGIPPTAADLQDSGRVTQLAFGECIRRVGEAVARIDEIDADWLATTFPNVPWRDVEATRNRLTHDDWTVDDGILHRIATTHLPVLTDRMAAFLDEPDPYATAGGAST
ncbi:MAG: DUF86 domain-containing protein [Acidimicrobiales bacterium]|nr:DUF86 domain-containing protein [Acidimicrobiales bacterium]